MKTKIGILIVVFLAAWGIQATPPRTVTGKVTDAADGSPIPGVNVLLKGTQHGTVTNGRGEYSLFIPGENGTLVFSFVGYTTKEMAIGTRSSVNVALQVDVSALSEVVVTGYSLEEKDGPRAAGKAYRHIATSAGLSIMASGHPRMPFALRR